MMIIYQKPAKHLETNTDKEDRGDLVNQDAKDFDKKWCKQVQNNHEHSIREFEASGNVERKLQHFVLTKNIYSRMEGLSRADSNILLPGGAGSLQEMFATLYLMMRARESNAPELELYRHNQVVVVNTPIEGNGQKRGFYDVTLDAIPARVFKDYPIHVVDTATKAVGVVVAHRSAMRAAGRRTGFSTDNL